MTSTLEEPQLRPLLLVRALELGGVFKRDLNGKTTSNEEVEEELRGQSPSQHSFTLTHAIRKFIVHPRLEEPVSIVLLRFSR